MGHNLTGLGSASLDVMGGLITNVAAEDLPEGASPRCWDVDYIVGSVFTRPGLSSVYSFTSTLTITAVSIRSGIATFVYAPSSIAPVVNEGFLLSGFTGSAFFLNGETVVVSSVDIGINTFFAVVDFPDLDQVTDLNASASSTTGNFVGPNVGTHATVIDSDGNTWSNPSGVLGNAAYASTITGSTVNQTVIPASAVNQAGPNPWTNPANLLSTTTAFTQVSLGSDTTSATILAGGINFAIPADATVVGISTTLAALTTSAAGKGSFNIQLATNGAGISNVVNVPVSQSSSFYTQGSAFYQWGTTLTTDIVNGPSFGVLVNAVAGVGGQGTFTASHFSITLYYTTASSSEVLQVTAFAYSIPSTSGISGIGATFEAFSTEDTTVTLQLLKNGIPVGEPKSQVLTTTPTIYSLGTANDMWGDTWIFSEINNTAFGVQITASGTGTTSIRDLDTLVYITPGLANFNYIKSFIQNSGNIDTLALDSAGIMWREDVDSNPGILAVALTGILPGSFAKSATALDQEYICFSDLAIGTERPRVYTGTQFLPLSQVGPGAPPSFVSSVGQSGQQLQITNFEISGNVVTFTFIGIMPTPGELYQITGAAQTYLNFTGTVLATGLTPTTFQMELVHADVAPTATDATATLVFSYPISSITQPAQHSGFIGYQWTAGPGQVAPGTVFTIYYGDTQDNTLVTAFNSGLYPVYVYLANNQFNFTGTYQVTSVGRGIPAGHDTQHYFFTVNVGSSGSRSSSGSNPPGSYQQTLATLTTTTPVPGLVQGDTILITQATPSQWNSAWPIVNALKSGVLNITNTAMSATGVATYQFNVASGVGPSVNDIITIANCTNNNIFNTTGVISSVTGSQFTISGFNSGVIPPAFESNATGITFGKQFLIDPGAKTLGLATSPIYGNDTNTGIVTLNGGSTTPIGAGTRQAVVFFITESGYETAPSPPFVFTTSSQANFINVGDIPIGPPNVIARGIAFTEAGQNGVPGANFYVIPDDVTITVGNITTVYTSTIIRDNVTTSAKFTFTDAILLNSTEIDIQGNDLFNLIELGSSAWCIPYASRMFYGLQLNKVDNFNNLTFDGGYLPNEGGNILPLGWTVDVNTIGTTLNISPVTGMSLYISNNTGATEEHAGRVYQTAFQDTYLVPIIRPNTVYSVRVAARCPSGVQVGTLKLSLTDFNQGIGFGIEYGSFEVPLTDMTSNTAVFSGVMLTTPFTKTVSSALQFVLEVVGLGDGADCEIDRIEVFPTVQPFLKAQVYGSYLNNLEAIDASGSGGIIDTSTENTQDCMGGFVMHDNLYLLKSNSMYFTQDDVDSEPSGWGIHEVSNKVGTIGIHSYDAGEEWLVTACRTGIYGFNGGQPVKLTQEIWNVWELINWDAGNTIVLRNDLVNRRLLCAVPLATPNKWLPFEPENPHPTSPNVILMCNYQGMNSFEELVSGSQVHTTMFGTLAAVDMRRKWSIWRIPTPYMDFIARQAGENDKPLFVCNGILSSKIYQFLDDQLSDDGVAINGLYTVYGFVNATKAATLPIFGFHNKRYTLFQTTMNGAGAATIRFLQNTLSARYPYSIPRGITLSDPAQNDYIKPLNVSGNRCFIEFSTNHVGHWFQLHKILLSGKADAWSAINPTGGGNQGFPSV